MKIYLVTVIADPLPTPDKALKLNSRTIGFFAKEEDAAVAIIENSDIRESKYYSYAVIEEFEEGIWACSTKEVWYKWDNGSPAKFIKKPEELNHIICFGIG